MNIPRFSVQNPLFVNLMTVFLILAGVLALFTVQRESFPPISFDRVMIQTVYPGANAHILEKFVTIKIEDELKGVDGIDKIESVSAENISIIMVQLDPDAKHKRKIITNVQRAVDRVSDLPSDLQDKPVVTEVEVKNFPVITASLSGLPYDELHTTAKSLEDVLLDIDEVSVIQRSGYYDPEIWVDVDPEKARAYHLSLSEIMEALRQTNVNLSAGKIESEGSELIMRVNKEFEGPADVERVIIRSNDQGYPVRVRDVASVTKAYEDTDTLFRTNGKEAINLIVVKRESGDILRLVKRVKKAIKQFQLGASEDLEIAILSDMSYYVTRRLNVLVNNGSMAAILIMVLLFVLLTPQIAATAALDIPVTFLATIAVLALAGMTINLMTMFGLIMVIGMLVDDAVIMSENIHRHIESGEEIHEAAVRGAEEVMRPISTAVFTSLCAFLPLLLMSGIVGQYVRAIPLVVCTALFISWLTTLISIPSHAAEFTLIARRLGIARHKEGHWFDRIRDGYLFILRKAIDMRYLVLTGTVTLFLFTIFVICPHIKFVMFNSEGMTEFFIQGKGRLGTTLVETQSKLAPVEDIVESLPRHEWENYVTEVGLQRQDPSDPNADRGTHLGQIHVFLTPPADRKRDALEIIREIETKLKGISSFEELHVERVQPGPPIGKAVEAKIRGDSFETIQEVVELYKEFLRKIEGVKNVQDDFNPGKDEIFLLIDRAKASRAFLTFESIAREIRRTFEGGIATTIQKSAEEIDVRVKYPEKLTKSLEIFASILIPNTHGNLVPLKAISNFERKPGLAAIKRFDAKRVIMVSADVNHKLTTSGEVNAALKQNFKDISSRYPEIQVVYAGEEERSLESLKSLLQASLLALVLIYFVIALQFRSLFQPIVVLTTIPLAFVGVVIAFFLHGKSLVFLALLGMVGLAGVVVNESIVLVVFFNKLRQQSVARRASILESCANRFRAVMLASLTTVCGTLPIAYGIGGDDPFLRPMALAFSWGLAFSIPITLIFIPCAYSIVDDIRFFIFHRGTVKKDDAEALRI